MLVILRERAATNHPSIKSQTSCLIYIILLVSHHKLISIILQQQALSGNIHCLQIPPWLYLLMYVLRNSFDVNFKHWQMDSLKNEFVIDWLPTVNHTALNNWTYSPNARIFQYFAYFKRQMVKNSLLRLLCPGVWNSLGVSMLVGVNYNKRGSMNSVTGSVATASAPLATQTTAATRATATKGKLEVCLPMLEEWASLTEAWVQS